MAGDEVGGAPTVEAPLEESDTERLSQLLEDNSLSFDLVSAFAGDRELREAERAQLDEHKRRRPADFFSDLLFAVTHQYFPPDLAEQLWADILRHKFEMSQALKRNTGIAVASLDYLSNLTSDLRAPTVIDEARILRIVRRSVTDALTGLFNHAICYQKIDAELRRYDRYGTICSLLMIDVDDFKVVNDTYGHQQGDLILSAVASALLHATRSSDICCRYGGEEFAIILPSTDAPAAGALAQRLLGKVDEALSTCQRVTVSIGVATCGPDTRTSSLLVKKADAALYQAKHSGKHQVVVSP